MRWMSFSTSVRPWLPLAVMGVLALGAVLWLKQDAAVAAQSPAGAKRASAPVRVATVALRDVPVEVQAVGMVQSSEQAEVRARVEGLLKEVRFHEGQAVRAGEVLARLDDREARAEVARLAATVDQLGVQRDQARADLQRYEDLARQAAVSAQQREQQAASASQLEAQWRAAQASLESARVRLDHTVIRAPISGRVGLRQVDVGNLVRPADAQGVVTLTRLDPIHVVFAVPQSRWSELRESLAATRQPSVTLTEAGAAPGATSAAPLKGRVLTRDNQIDAATGTLRLKAVFDNADERLLPGQSVMVRLPVRVLKDVLLMPATAVQPGLRGDMVWRIKGAPEGRPQAEAVWVDVVWRDDDQVAVRAGLAEGDQVVVDGQSRLKPGAGVRVMTPAEPTPSVGGAS